MTPSDRFEQRYSEPCLPSPGVLHASSTQLDAELRSSRVYSRAIHRRSLSSLRTSSVHSHGWSCLSGLSLAEISDTSIISLPLSAGELWNPRPYIGADSSNDQQAENVSGAIPHPKSEVRSSTGAESGLSSETGKTLIATPQRSSTSSTVSNEPARSPLRRLTMPRMKVAGFRPQSTVVNRRRVISAPNPATSSALDLHGTILRPGVNTQKPIKVWLAGGGESGKSTILKQMRMAYSNGLSLLEREQAQQSILCNLLLAFKSLIAEMIDLQIPYQSRKTIVSRS